MLRAKEAHQKIYQDRRWKDLRALKYSDNPVCECCKRKYTEHIHHIIPFAQFIDLDYDKALEYAFDYDNLSSLCEACHIEVHKFMNMELEDFELLLEVLEEVDSNFNEYLLEVYRKNLEISVC
ncbi:hypothetical protein DF185_07950 [Marinifilum breve]|uniref:Putative HNH nuclease YajD n=1 Tax=Marinifilum breve TaxID=2184082 RepID=A0A2V3ZYA5_9BACT|nr:HNH endonuclease signature motif containing protein [Marinifilum breve]PXY01408.1 hypothetical protein DF185_07950 [Marinifilum breve]